MMELLIMCDALKRASAQSITAVIPYFGYARQDRKVAPRTPITAKLVADLIEPAGVTRVVSMDMHAAQIQGFFNIPSTTSSPRRVSSRTSAATSPTDEAVLVSPDAGGVERARAYSKRLNASLAIVDKRRTAQRLRGDEPHRRRPGKDACSSTTWWTPPERSPRRRRR